VINSNLNTVVIASGTSTPIEIVNKIINKIKGSVKNYDFEKDKKL